MQELMQLIENRQSARGLFDPERAIPAEDMEKILEAARWTPTAHNMQNFEIVVVDDKQPLAAISEIKVPVDPTFIRENYPQLSFTEDELRRKKTGIMGTMFPKSWQTPDPDLEEIKNEDRSAFMAK
jgi:nitroreductase